MNNHVTLWIDGVISEVHTFNTPVSGEPGFYRAVTSIDAFSSREGTILYELNQKGIQHTPGKRCHVRWGTEVKMLDVLGHSEMLKDVPHFEHASLWDFYQAIGYDYKKKRYTS